MAKYHFEAVDRTSRLLRILPGSYYDCVMPPDAESMWGPVPLPPLSPGDADAENVCKAVTHRLMHNRRD